MTPYYAADLLRRGDVRGLAALWLNLHRSYPVPALRLTRNLLWRFGARDVLSGRSPGASVPMRTGVLRRHRLRGVRAETPDWALPTRRCAGSSRSGRWPPARHP